MSKIVVYLSVVQHVQPSLTELFGGIHASYASSKYFTWLPLLAVVYCSSFVKRIRSVREVCQRQIGDCTIWPGITIQPSSDSKIVQSV